MAALRFAMPPGRRLGIIHDVIPGPSLRSGPASTMVWRPPKLSWTPVGLAVSRINRIESKERRVYELP